jgi:hypothetical protein
MEKVPYKAIVGCIMCVMITTRLNIDYNRNSKPICARSKVCALETYKMNREIFGRYA